MPRLLIDAPRSQVVAGVLDGEVRFDGGISVRFPRRQFGFVSLTSADGNALQASRDIRVFASDKSTNSGFMFDPDGVDFKGLTGVVKGVRSAGQAPGVFERPGFMLVPPRAASRLEWFDFNLRAYRPPSDDLTIRTDEPFSSGVISE